MIGLKFRKYTPPRLAFMEPSKTLMKTTGLATEGYVGLYVSLAQRTLL